MDARHTITPLKSPHQTAAEMVRLVRTYSGDLGSLSKLPLPGFYRKVRALPFRSDPKGEEMVSRPKFTLQKDWPWRDCDDKSVLIGSYLHQNGIPFRFVASSKRKDGQLHHVFPVATINGRDLPLDATYPHEKFGIETAGITHRQNLTGEIMPNLHILEGDETELLGRGFFSRQKRRQKRRLRNIHKKSMSYSRRLPGPARYIVNPANRIISSTLSGEEIELLGRGFLSRMKRKARKSSRVVKRVSKKTARQAVKVGKVVAKNPALRAAISAAIPGGAAALAMAESLAKKARPALRNLQNVQNEWNKATAAPAPVVDETDYASMVMPTDSKEKKMLIYGGAGLLAVGALIVLTRKR